MMLKHREVQTESNQRGAQAAGFPLQFSVLGLMASALRTFSLLICCSPGSVLPLIDRSPVSQPFVFVFLSLQES